MTRMGSMFRVINILCVTLFISLAFSEKWIAERGAETVSWPENIQVPAPIKYNGTITETTPALDGRSLVNSWLQPRGFVCSNSGWQVCPTQFGCCPTTQLCCPNTPYCKAATTDVCCSVSGTCPANFECTSLCRCIETGGECCSDGNYCQKGNICVVSPYGAHGCCTDLKCTAYVSNGVTVPLTPTYTPTQPATTRPAEPTITQNTYYYFTITWSYYFYYYYTFVQVVTTSTLTSSYTTEYTTVSVLGANSAAASSSFKSISSAFVPSTPAAATTALAQPTDQSTSPAITATPGGPSSLSSLTSSSALGINTSLRAGGSGAVTGALGAGSRVFGATIGSSWTIVMLSLIAIATGLAGFLL